MKTITYLFLGLIVAFGLLFALRPERTSVNTAGSDNSQVSDADVAKIKLTHDMSYFSDEATVMYFWFDDCIYCKRQSPILEEITEQYGYQVKSMNVEENPEYWQQYEVGGTPAFLASNGQRLSGYQSKEALLKFFEENE